ncbi:MAG: class I SAM-dependent DNA methyltransferase, partial [Chromatiaceae bacterium]|nr:class I SAM-dependent DNA methyltransferase [Chromatiaceae bacterium]
LFAQGQALPLDRDQLDLLIDAGRADWRQVEPAIFGTLLERALDPRDRHALGAHYTPRAYVERLVLPTVIAPLREEWTAVHSAAFRLHEQGRDPEAIKLISAFQVRLANIRVLDPACGSGNFLYVTLEHLKRLEGEVLDTLESLGERQLLMAMEGVSVDPHQLLGLELNPRAAAIAETVLWIGYLQWHFRTHGNVNPPEPVIRDFRNIQCRDAVLAYDRVAWVTDASGRPVTRWDGRTYKPHPVTGELVPDESAQVLLERYVNPRRAEWPEADYVVGNPPFIGNKRMRQALGDGYVEALRAAWPDMPGSADYVMYWWHEAAKLARTGGIKRFGFITTNSLTQSFNRQVVEKHLTAGTPLSLVFAIPDHPWVDTSDGAAVRIAMSVGIPGSSSGLLARVTREESGSIEGMTVALDEQFGVIHPDLTVGARAASAVRLEANRSLCFQGMNLVGKGFRITLEEVKDLGYSPGNLPEVIKPHRNARDMMQGGADVFVIDLFGYSAEKARIEHPALYQRLLDRVKPERDHNKDAQRRRDWWLFGRSNAALRQAWVGLARIILTPETAKHHVFAFQELPFCPDHKLYAICSDDAFVLGVLSSKVHCIWALRAGGRLGFGNDPTWTNTTCFLPFSIPAPDALLKARIRQLAEELDAHRKARQALHPGLTMTGMYNVLDLLRRGAPLSPKDRQIHEQGLVSVLRQLHDELDAAVLAAYGWEDLAAALAATPVGAASRRAGPGPDTGAEDPAGTTLAPTESGTALDQAAAVEETLLQRLVALNAERAAEERRGLIRWLRPDFQHPGAGATLQAEATMTATTPAPSGPKPDWPKTLPDQFQALRAALAARPGPLNAADLAQGFTRAPRARVAELLDTLATLGHIRRLPDGRYLPG